MFMANVTFGLFHFFLAVRLFHFFLAFRLSSVLSVDHRARHSSGSHGTFTSETLEGTCQGWKELHILGMLMVCFIFAIMKSP